jgi:hypothetical protein
MHDWTKVSAGTFHDFHCSWVTELKKTLNGGLLPPDFYAQAEQIAGEIGPDVLTLQTRGESREPADQPHGATALAEAPPRVSHTAELTELDAYALKRRTLVIRHSSGDQIVALIEILSPGNKNRLRALERFIDKAVSVLIRGYHLMLIDPHPPGPFDPKGIHAALWSDLGDERYQPPPEKPLTLASYRAGPRTSAYVEPIGVGQALPAMPLFLDEAWYVNVPLEPSYAEAYQTIAERWRRVIEGRDQ